METTTKAKPKRRFKKVFKFLLIGIGVLIIAGFIGHWVWVSSGSNEWEKALEKDGVVVHTLKQPGKFVLQMKAIKRVRSKLGAFVSVMQDVEAMCTHGCYEAKVLKRESDSHLLSTFTRFDLPYPMQDREWVLENHFSQDPDTKELLYNIRAVPHIVPENEGYVRIKHFNNSWRFIPLENGEVEVVWLADMDQGGYVVNLLFNLASADAMRNSFLEIEEMLKKEKHQMAKYDFVKEVDEVTTAERSED
jgi:hypothetical protein